MIGLYGKLPAHGDFVRRGLPQSFVRPWDAWLQTCIAFAQQSLQQRFAQAWSDASPWRFCLPAGCYATVVVRELADYRAAGAGPEENE